MNAFLWTNSLLFIQSQDYFATAEKEFQQEIQGLQKLVNIHKVSYSTQSLTLVAFETI